MKKALDYIRDERESQFSRGYGREHDAQHTRGELLEAADCHLDVAIGRDVGKTAQLWPWDPNTFRVNTDVSSLVKAAALIAAEVDRRIAAGECRPTDFAS